MATVSLGLKLVGILKQIDIFGAPLQLSIQSQDKAYQSVYGGLSTICIYSFSLYYLIYLFIEWQTKELKPQINIQTISKEYDDLILPFNVFRLSLVDDEFGPYIRKLNQTGYFWNQSVSVWKDWDTNVESVPNPDSYSCGRQSLFFNLFSPLCQNTDIPDQMFLRQNKNNSLTTYLDYTLTPCNPKKDKNCITFEQLTKYRKPYWDMFVRRQDVDIRNGNIIDFESEYFFDLNANSSTSINIKLVKATVMVDEGFLWPSYKQTDIIKDVIVTSSLSSSSGSLIVLEISLEKNAEVIYLIYPKITFILSQAGSMLQTLLVLGMLANLLNSKHMENFIKEKVMKVYFPTFQNYYFESTLTGRVTGVRRYGSNKVLHISEQKKILEARQNIMEVISHKLSILNIIQDMNKLQIAIQQLYPKGFNFQGLNYRLSFDHDQDGFEVKRYNPQPDEDDFFRFFQQKLFLSDSLTPTGLVVQPYDSDEGSQILNQQRTPVNKSQISPNPLR